VTVIVCVECGQRVERKLGAWWCPTHHDRAAVRAQPIQTEITRLTTKVEDLRLALLLFVDGVYGDGTVDADEALEHARIILRRVGASAAERGRP
jgi:hypothetical protein